MPRDSPEGHLAETREPTTKALYRVESCSREMKNPKTEDLNFKPKPETNSEETKQVLLKLEELPINTFQNAKLPKKTSRKEIKSI
jgi:pyruvate-formate lyase